MKHFYLLAALLLAAGCAVPVYQATDTEEYLQKHYYTAELFGSEPARDIQSLLGNEGQPVQAYEDSLILIVWEMGWDRLSFQLQNKTAASMKLPWDEMAYVNVNGISERVMHENMLFMDRGSVQPAAVIPRRGQIVNGIIPLSHVVSGSSGPSVRSMFRPGYKYEGTASDAQKNVGQKVSVLFPVESQGQTHEYMFHFVVTKVKSPEEVDPMVVECHQEGGESAIIAGRAVPVHAYDSRDANVVMTLEYGTSVQVMGESRSFTSICVKDQLAWVKSDNIGRTRKSNN